LCSVYNFKSHEQPFAYSWAAVQNHKLWPCHYCLSDVFFICYFIYCNWFDAQIIWWWCMTVTKNLTDIRQPSNKISLIRNVSIGCPSKTTTCMLPPILFRIISILPNHESTFSFFTKQACTCLHVFRVTDTVAVLNHYSYDCKKISVKFSQNRQYSQRSWIHDFPTASFMYKSTYLLTYFVQHRLTHFPHNIMFLIHAVLTWYVHLLACYDMVSSSIATHC